jgi:hypothetical protein
LLLAIVPAQATSLMYMTCGVPGDAVGVIVAVRVLLIVAVGVL